MNPEGLKGALDARSRSKVRSDAELMQKKGLTKGEDSDAAGNAVLICAHVLIFFEITYQQKGSCR